MKTEPVRAGATTGDVLRSLAFYAAFYGGTILLVLVALLAWAIALERFRIVVHYWSSWHRWCARMILGITVESEGFIPRGRVLYAIKHESFFEAIDVPNQYPLPVVFAKQQLMRIPLWGTVGRRYGLIGVDRAGGASAFRAMLAEARQRVADGRPLVIFPEGTRVPHGTRPPLQAGFAGLYKMLGLPVIPVAVDSGPLYQRRWKRAGTIHYRFGTEIPPGLPREELEVRVLAAINALNP
ncbi:MAG: lysophospholipid acyltransferase family protein [Novosphingobium sp.]